MKSNETLWKEMKKNEALWKATTKWWKQWKSNEHKSKSIKINENQSKSTKMSKKTKSMAGCCVAWKAQYPHPPLSGIQWSSSACVSGHHEGSQADLCGGSNYLHTRIKQDWQFWQTRKVWPREAHIWLSEFPNISRRRTKRH